VGDDEVVVGSGVEDAARAIGIAEEHQDFGWEEDGIDPKFEEFPGFSFHTIANAAMDIWCQGISIGAVNFVRHQR
jgi:hypothetical protein